MPKVNNKKVSTYLTNIVRQSYHTCYVRKLKSKLVKKCKKSIKGARTMCDI